MPSPEVLARAYPANYHSFHLPASWLTQILVDISRKRQARAIAGKLESGASILDIGCSTGDLLQAIGELGRFRLYGVENSEQVATIARGNGITVLTGSFEDVELSGMSFDLISMQHVLEHVTDPKFFLARSFQLLNRNGLLTGELPNYDSWDARLFGRYWGGGYAPRHIWHFSPATLRRALENAGFVMVRVQPALHTEHWACSIQNFLRRRRFDDVGLTNGRARY
jgi:SAM-dependent methyltransferase